MLKNFFSVILFIFMFFTVITLANANIWDVDNDQKLGLKDIIYGLQLIAGHHEMPEKKKVVLINLGDSLTNGAKLVNL